MEVRANDFGYDLTFNIKEIDGVTAKNLTGVTSAKLQVATVENYRNIVDGACVISDFPNGVVKYTVKLNDFVTEGTYKAIIKMFTGLTNELSTKEFFLTVLRKLGKVS